ncbi:MAG: outer membrane lipoprotein-sorting protein, partial [Campylobacterales bacterium]|nr:outer membrane lipoprotein-sorting protein [Campylobacterales bacterium]
MIKKLLLTLTLGSTVLLGQTGLEIMQKVLDRDDGDNIITNMQMQLIDKEGHKRIRDMRTYSKDKGKDELKLIFFLSPSDVKNT